jgi:hypothetical protein
MNVSIKKFNVEMILKNNGIELEVRTPGEKEHRGDMIINKTGMVWCPGQVMKKNGNQKTWDEIIDFFSK